jgi:hypothetical protein
MDARDVYKACGVPENSAAYYDLCRLHHSQGVRDEEEQRRFADLWIVLSQMLYEKRRDPFAKRVNPETHRAVPVVFTDIEDGCVVSTTSYRVFTVFQVLRVAVDVRDTYEEMLADARPVRTYAEHASASEAELRIQYDAFMQAIRRVYLVLGRERGAKKQAPEVPCSPMDRLQVDEYLDLLVLVHLELQLVAAWVRGCLAFKQGKLRDALSYWKLGFERVWFRIDEAARSDLTRMVKDSLSIAYCVAMGEQGKGPAGAEFRDYMFAKATAFGWHTPAHLEKVTVELPDEEEAAEENIFVAAGVVPSGGRATSAPPPS